MKLNRLFRRLLIVLLPMAAVLLQVGCATRSTPAPVVDRSSGRSLEPVAPGYYRVKRGDTLLRIALDHGQSHRDIAEWNGIADVNVIEVDQVIRVAPPKSASVSKVEVRQEKAANDPKSKDLKGKLDKQDKSPKLADNKSSNDNVDKAKDVTEPGIRLSWPSKGDVIDRFDDTKNKGIDISGKAGDPVQSAADGKVVYAGNSLRGYGNLVIVKHDNTYLTAYAHNKTLLVKEGDTVKKAQKIAEMGNTDADRVKLHFELRKNGKPVDPTTYLP
ncbi:peptidoglycan DD-metalloendopeptidase family protein [Polynucleobacter sp. MWH-Spelu-300-X4]|uniref:peptidoglycan DD-metalloendopeptidase family protein n=1 Tax=Polynucleobacter sp. MWH-Spelu-300-X4 TaxID=2689109 RepID=UPI001BFD6BD7|nr:peptidoglycan DD-metalloendopeptidase family protein [Polynucleobacter sp. MWH-Spelu-300-X4]QWD80494.1 peptidoglycan DD-metalloendopeptidase family protein [Polynucleobacter sp. MWH-Spelu-300-X4]